MLRHTFSSNIRQVSQKRGFVSTVLLTRDWKNETVSVLKQEAKKRGLLQTGNKATLITRLSEHDRAQAMQNPSPVTQQARHASTTEAPGAPSSSQSPPPANYPREFLDVKIPDVSIPFVQKLAPVPFVPDLWDSSRVKAESAPAPLEEPTTPKVLTVSGHDPKVGDVVSHNLYPDPSPTPSTSSPTAQKGVFTELLHDLVPEAASIKLPGEEVPAQLLEGLAETTQTSGKRGGSHSRPLDSEERNGVWALLGLFAGSYVLAGALAPTPVEAKAPHHDKPASEKTADKH